MNIDKEFKLIPGFGDKYSINRNGEVFSTHRNIKLKQTKSTSGYQCVKLLIPYDKNIESKQYLTQYIHRLVAQAFIPNPRDKPQVNHIDGYKSNNTVDNLEWCTAIENITHAVQTGLTTLKTTTNSEVQKIDIMNRLLNSTLNWYDAVKEMGIHRTNAKKSILNTATKNDCYDLVITVIKQHEKQRAIEATKKTSLKNSKVVRVINTLTNAINEYESASIAAIALNTTPGNIANSCANGHFVKEIYKCTYL